MNTKEFIKKVQALGYEVEVDLESMFIIKIEGTAVCDVSKTEFGILDTDSYSGFKHIGYSFLTKSAKIKLQVEAETREEGYSFLTKSAKIKLRNRDSSTLFSYSFLTKSAKIKLHKAI